MRRMIDVAVLEQLTLSSINRLQCYTARFILCFRGNGMPPVDGESGVGGLGRYFFQ